MLLDSDKWGFVVALRDYIAERIETDQDFPSWLFGIPSGAYEHGLELVFGPSGLSIRSTSPEGTAGVQIDPEIVRRSILELNVPSYIARVATGLTSLARRVETCIGSLLPGSDQQKGDGARYAVNTQLTLDDALAGGHYALG